MYCCNALKNSVASAGERGPAILAYARLHGQIGFVIQSRGVAYRDEPKLKACPIDISINVSSEISVHFCPYCGHRLSELVEQNLEFFQGIVNDHSPFLAAMPKPYTQPND